MCVFAYSKKKKNKAAIKKPKYGLQFEGVDLVLLDKNVEINNTIQYVFKKDLILNVTQKATLFSGTNIKV